MWNKVKLLRFKAGTGIHENKNDGNQKTLYYSPWSRIDKGLQPSGCFLEVKIEFGFDLLQFCTSCRLFPAFLSDSSIKALIQPALCI